MFKQYSFFAALLFSLSLFAAAPAAPAAPAKPGSSGGNFAKFREELRAVRTAEAAREYQIALKHYQNAQKFAESPYDKKRVTDAIADTQAKIKSQKAFYDQITAETAKNWDNDNPVNSSKEYFALLDDARLSVTMKTKIANDFRNLLNKTYNAQKDKKKGPLPTDTWLDYRVAIAKSRAEWRGLNEKTRNDNFLAYARELHDCNHLNDLLHLGTVGLSRLNNPDAKAQYMLLLMRAADRQRQPQLLLQFAEITPVPSQNQNLLFDFKSLSADAHSALKNDPAAQKLYREAISLAQEAGPKKVRPDQIDTARFNLAESLLRSAATEEFEKIAADAARSAKNQNLRRRWALLQLQLAESQHNPDKFFAALQFLAAQKPNPRELNDARFRGLELLLRAGRKKQAFTEINTLNRAPGINANDRKRLNSIREQAEKLPGDK